MVTLRAFSTQGEAALAKSLLEDHGIVCSLADENSWLYGGAPFAMPVRLIVAEEQLEAAARILEDPPDGVNATLPKRAMFLSEAAKQENESVRETNNPWEFLVIGLAVLIPGIVLLLKKGDLVIVASMQRRGITVMPAANAHILGVMVIGAALFLLFLFFYVRRAIARDQSNCGNTEPHDAEVESRK